MLVSLMPLLRVLIYIPLCFYFIVILFLYRRTLRFNLHSTMLLLYQLLKPGVIIVRMNLHSTMLLLYHGFAADPPIYGSYLHSTMLLLYREILFRAKRIAEFTFHYASTLSETCREFKFVEELIYIPLCFYFIMSDMTPATNEIIFTFHYASTLSKDLELTIITKKKFTFHYASTLSTHWGSMPRRQQYLHSTMLLLYRSITQLSRATLFIYIPLCFYFIGCPAMLRCTAMLIYIPLCFYFIGVQEMSINITFSFTFHYASTLSAGVATITVGAD